MDRLAGGRLGGDSVRTRVAGRGGAGAVLRYPVGIGARDPRRDGSGASRQRSAGRHQCFDRLVLDFQGQADGYRVEYVSTVRSDGSGQVVPLRGGAKLQVVALAPAYDSAGNPTFRPANRNELVNVAGWSTFRQVASAGSFEGHRRSASGSGRDFRSACSPSTAPGPAAES